MLTDDKRTRIIQTLVVLLIAFAIKWFYSTASVNELRWILAPTATVVEWVTGESFQFESYAGYMSSDHSFLIAPSCSGVNFLIAAFLMLILVRLWKGKVSRTIIPFAAIAAYLTTIVANTVRISVALRLHRMDRETVWINPDQLHRFEGIFIYFGFLLLLFVLSEAATSEPTPRSMASTLLRRSWLPLLIYWTTTLGVPLVNGAHRQGTDFWEHALFVLLTPLILILPLAAFHLMTDRRPNTDRPAAHWFTL